MNAIQDAIKDDERKAMRALADRITGNAHPTTEKERARTVYGWCLVTGHGNSFHLGPNPPECWLPEAWKPVYQLDK